MSEQPPVMKVTGSVVTRPARWRYVFWTLLIGGICVILAIAALHR